MRVTGPFLRASLHESHRLEPPNRRTEEEVLAGSRFRSIMVGDTLEEQRQGNTRARLFSLWQTDRRKSKPELKVDSTFKGG